MIRCPIEMGFGPQGSIFDRTNKTVLKNQNLPTCASLPLITSHIIIVNHRLVSCNNPAKPMMSLDF